MSRTALDRGAVRLASALCSGLLARDRRQEPPRFGDLWPAVARSARPLRPWRPAFAAFTVLGAIAALSWIWVGRVGAPQPQLLQARAVDPLLAQELSSPGYWRVPTDELLTHAAPSGSFKLPSPPSFAISLEESLL